MGIRDMFINWYNEILYRINSVLCLIKANSNTIELTVHTSYYWILDLLCVIVPFSWVNKLLIFCDQIHSESFEKQSEENLQCLKG